MAQTSADDIEHVECSNCGEVNAASFAFCAGCGHGLADASPHESSERHSVLEVFSDEDCDPLDPEQLRGVLYEHEMTRPEWLESVEGSSDASTRVTQAIGWSGEDVAASFPSVPEALEPPSRRPLVVAGVVVAILAGLSLLL